MSQKVKNRQIWLNAHGATLEVDGKDGPATRKAIIDVFRNSDAPAVTEEEIAGIAARNGFDVRALKAVAQVESSGSGWDDKGLLKCLYERHYLWRRVKIAVPFLSNPKGGGYTIDADKNGINDSWEKLAKATSLFGFDVAFECASFGKFQIMGAHWKALKYDSVAEFVWGMSRNERAHYEAFARFINTNNLRKALNQVDGDPKNCLAIAEGYNGKAQNGYDKRIAKAWLQLG